MHPKTSRGTPPVNAVTLAELMIGVAVAGIIMAAAAFYMSGYVPRATLNREAEKVRAFLIRAQQRARDEREAFCFTVRRSAPPVFSLYLDADRDSVCNPAVDPLREKMELSRDVEIPDCSWGWVSAPALSIVVQPRGSIVACRRGSPCWDPFDLHLIVRSARLAPKNRAREIRYRASVTTVELLPPAEKYVVGTDSDDDGNDIPIYCN